MVDTKPTPAWAVTSLVVSVLGWLAAAPLPLLDYGYIIGSTAGVGMIGPFLLGLLSGTLALAGVILGAVALARTRGGGFGGRGQAWAGVALGGVLLLAYGTVTALSLVGADIFQR
jgi:hypothetical protein